MIIFGKYLNASPVAIYETAPSSQRKGIEVIGWRPEAELEREDVTSNFLTLVATRIIAL
ncbi:MAG: hypothetical protein G5Z42_07710 [Caldisphaeraceae archaeon]|nr:hypothetical protein [Caldisphaeraceae archaeon]MEB3691468.1 hypothetical protein [Caldisphaeraceae archaeon]MEB3798678.1 hypothetical protein [Caldisphaeraceae archaeon]